MVTFKSNNPQQLLIALKEAIRKGHVTTWIDVDGDFTHSPIQWVRKAYLRPSIHGSELRFAIIRPQNAKVSSEVYAVYHGRFIEMMLAHFDQQFSDAAASALATVSDVVAA